MSIGTYGEPDAVSKAIGYAEFRSRSHRAAKIEPKRVFLTTAQQRRGLL
jgi:hypothetical protein